MYFIINSDLNMGKGKIAAQVAHAAVELIELLPSEALVPWKKSGAKKVVLAGFFQDLLDAVYWAERQKLPFVVIRDAGHTQVRPGSVTVVAFAPVLPEKVPYLKSFRLI